jgi:nitroreductase
MPEMIRLEPPPRLRVELGEAMYTQRAIRRLKPDPVSDEDLHLILDAASKAPNGGNVQPGRFLVIRDREKIRRFGALYREAWWAKRKDEKHPWAAAEKREAIPPGAGSHPHAALLAEEMKDAPVVVLAFSLMKGRGNSVFPPAQNLMLAARAIGIGSTLTTLHPTVMERVYAMFNIPKEAEFHACIPLGYPRGKFGPTSRFSTAYTTYWDGWEQAPPWS